MQAKVDPYLRPLYDALDDMMPFERVAARARERASIEIAPLAFMRGRTLGDAFVIVDEAQNATAMQMKMLLTRLGVNSKMVITGDKTQVDLPKREDSGLIAGRAHPAGHRRHRVPLLQRDRRRPAPPRARHRQGVRGRRGGGGVIVPRHSRAVLSTHIAVDGHRHHLEPAQGPNASSRESSGRARAERADLRGVRHQRVRSASLNRPAPRHRRTDRRDLVRIRRATTRAPGRRRHLHRPRCREAERDSQRRAGRARKSCVCSSTARFTSSATTIPKAARERSAMWKRQERWSRRSMTRRLVMIAIVLGRSRPRSLAALLSMADGALARDARVAGARRRLRFRSLPSRARAPRAGDGTRRCSTLTAGAAIAQFFNFASYLAPAAPSRDLGRADHRRRHRKREPRVGQVSAAL